MSTWFEIWRRLPLFCRQWSLTTTTNEIVTTSKRLDMTSHGMETSKKWGLRAPTKSEGNHKELLCRHKIFNMLKICRRTRQIVSAGRLQMLPDSSATIDGNTQWLAGNSKLQCILSYTLDWVRAILKSTMIRIDLDLRSSYREGSPNDRIGPGFRSRIRV